MSSLSADIERLTTGLAAQIRDGFDWWARELRDLVPARLLFWLTDAGEREVVLSSASDGAVHLALRDKARAVRRQMKVRRDDDINAKIQELVKAAGLSSDEVALGLALPADRFFFREISLPREARRSIETIALRDLLYHTPFRADEIYHAHLAESAGSKILLRQSVIRRSLVEEAITDLDLAPETIGFVEVEGAVGNGYPEKLRVKDAPGKHKRLFNLFAFLTMTCVLLGCTSLVLAHQRQQAAIERLAGKVAEAQTQALQVRSNLDAAKEKMATLNALRGRKENGPSLLGIWEELSRILPDNSWVQELTLSKSGSEGYSLTISGFSAAAATLVEGLDRSPLLSEVTLTAPISVDPIEKRERFVLKAHIEGMQTKSETK